MTRAVKQLNDLGDLTKIGQGGQGVVYHAPGVKTQFADSMVYKECKPGVREEIDFSALAAMPELVENSLSYRDGERLISMAAWPCEIVEDDGRPVGYLMPEIPSQFTVPLTTLKGVSRNFAEFQHLLNSQSVLDARGIVIDDVQRYSLLREVASGLAFLHDYGVCVGDVSPKNLLFSLEPRPAVYFVDCDSMRINDKSALPQVETPGWEVPAGEDLATVYSDTYKLGLLALRLITGSQTARTLEDLPSPTPTMLRRIISDTLDNSPDKRPLPAAWIYVLGNVIEEAQHRKKTTATNPRAAVAPKTPGEAVTPAAPVETPLQPEIASNSLNTAPFPIKTLVATVIGSILAVGVLVAILVAIFADSGSKPSSSITSSRVRVGAPPASNPIQAPSRRSPPSQQVAIPPDATPCPSQSSGYNYPPNNAAIGNSHTTCVFAEVVRQRYIGQGQRGALVILERVYSPVTRQSYSMTCNTSQIVTCTGGNDALVYLY